MALNMVHDETFAIECPDVAISTGLAFGISALISVLDRHYSTIFRVHALDHLASCRYHPAVTYWTEHLSSPLKVRKNILLDFIIV